MGAIGSELSSAQAQGGISSWDSNSIQTLHQEQCTLSHLSCIPCFQWMHSILFLNGLWYLKKKKAVM